MDQINAAVWPNGTPDQMTPDMLNAQANSWADLLFTGLSGAAVNAAYRWSDTAGYQQPVGPSIGVSVGTSGNFMPLLVIGGLLYVLLSKG